jgi:hypothetical protein
MIGVQVNEEAIAMGNQRQDESNRNSPTQQQQGGNQNQQANQQKGGSRSSSPRTPDEIGRAGQDAGSIGSTSTEKADRERGGGESGSH